MNSIDANSIPEILVCEVKMGSMPKDSGILQMRSGNKIYLLNKSDKEVSMATFHAVVSVGLLVGVFDMSDCKWCVGSSSGNLVSGCKRFVCPVLSNLCAYAVLVGFDLEWDVLCAEILIQQRPWVIKGKRHLSLWVW